MTAIRSPLGALGAVMVFIEAIAAGALVAVRDNQMLQWMLGITIVVLAIGVTLFVCILIAWLAHRHPAWLFNLSELDPAVQRQLILPAEGTLLEVTRAPQDAPQLEVKSDEQS